MGVVRETWNDFVSADYSTTEGKKFIQYGARIRLADDYSNGGNAGSVYQYLGEDGEIDLGKADYSDAGYWKEVLETQFFPEGLNVTESDSKGIGGLVVFNDVRSSSIAYMDKLSVTAGDITVQAIENVTIKSIADSTVTSSGGSAFGKGESLAVNGTIASNVVVSQADAHITNSDITTETGDVVVDAANTSTIDAKTLSYTTSGENAVGVTLAFNILGWNSRNLLFNNVDALIGDPAVADAFGQQQPSEVKAYIFDTDVDSAGAIVLSAINEAALDATVTNESTSAAYALTDASGASVGAVLASNMVLGKARAYIDFTSGQGTVTAAGPISITAQDDTSIFANSRLAAISSTTNDAGISLLTQFADNVLGEYQYTDRSGVRDLENGDQVRIDDVDYTTLEEPDAVNKGDRIQIEFDLANETASAGEVYEYIGDNPLTGPVDLDGQNYKNTSLWKQITATPGGTYRYLGGGAEGVNLAEVDYNNPSLWLELISVDPRELIPGLTFNISDSDSMAFGGLVVRNDARGGAESYINNADVGAVGDVTLQALETATVRALDESVVTSSGGSLFGGGKSVAVNGVIATNMVLSDANAYITNSDVTATGAGDVSLDAQNTSIIDAEITSVTQSNGVSVGVTLAFNTIGWDAQNILFNTIDAIIGTKIGDEIPAEVQAYIQNSDVRASGGVSLSALSDAAISAGTGTSSTAIRVSADKSESVSVGDVVGMNRLSTLTQAFIDNASIIQANDGDIKLEAVNASNITSIVNVPSLAISAGTGNSFSVTVGLAIGRNEIYNDVDAFIDQVDDLSADKGSVILTAQDSAIVYAESGASSISVTVSTDKSIGVGGGGASAENIIETSSKAYITNSTVTAAGTEVGEGSVLLDAGSSSTIHAEIKTLSAAAGAGGGTSAGIAIGFSLAFNSINDGDDPSRILAYIENSDVTASKNISLTAQSDNTVDATVAAAAVAISASTDKSGALTVGGVLALNEIDTDVKAYIEEADAVSSGGDLTLIAKDISRIHSEALSAALSGNISGSSGAAVSIGLSIARNAIAGDVEAYINNIASLDVNAGSILIDALRSAKITAASAAGAVALSGAGSNSFAIGGGGATAENAITGNTKAYIAGSQVESGGDVIIHAKNIAVINALILAASGAVSIAGSTGAAVSVGVSVARNLIGYDLNGSKSTSEVKAYIENSSVDADGALSLIAETLDTREPILSLNSSWSGSLTDAASIDLDDPDTTAIDENAEDVLDDAAFLNNVRDAFEAKGFLLSENVTITVLKENESWMVNDDQGNVFIIQKEGSSLNVYHMPQISAAVLAGSVAVAGSGGAGIGLSGGGVYAENKIATDVKAYISGDGVDGINVHSITLKADDSSAIFVIAGAASIAGTVSGSTGVSASIGLAIARNEISNNVEAYLQDAQNVHTSDAATGFIDIDALSDASIDSISAAASVSIGVGSSSGVGISGGGAVAENIILGKTNAFIEDSNATTAGDVLLDARNTSSIDAIVAVISGAVGGGSSAGVAASLGVSIALNKIGWEAEYHYTTNSISQEIRKGEKVKLADDYQTTYIEQQDVDDIDDDDDTTEMVIVPVQNEGKGEAGEIYEYLGEKEILNLGDQDYSDTTLWKKVTGKPESTPAEIQAYIVDSKITAGGKIEQNAIANESIDAIVVAGSVAIGLGGSAGVALSGAGVYTENKISTNVKSYIGDSTTTLGDASSSIIADQVIFKAQDVSSINAIAGAASVAGSVGGSAGVSVSLGLSLAFNRIDNQVEAYLSNLDGVQTTSSGVKIESLEDASISAISSAASVAIGGGASAGVAVSGGGAVAENIILGKANAFIDNSIVQSAGDVDLDAKNTSKIDAVIAVASGSVGIGGSAGVAVSVGFSIARNFIGWDADWRNDPFDIIASEDHIDVKTYIQNSQVAASGSLTQDAESRETINALVLAGSIALAGGTAGVGVTGAGVMTENRVTAHVKSYIDGTGAGSTTIEAESVSLNASDASTINAIAGSASVAGSVGAVGVSVSIGLSVALNQIGSEVESYILQADVVTAENGS
ncbi:MAG: hypothetical protein ACP5I1_00645, partial [Candidatus Hinthialibacter sp.]